MKLYQVGGAVRDSLLGKTAADVDYVLVGATYAEAVAKYGAPIGRSFPVFKDADGHDVALARRERKTGPGHTDFNVDAGPDVTLLEDLARRDFTCNSIARDLETGALIDPFNGVADINARLLRHTSDAFVEDPLRVFRLARFAATLGFKIAPATVDVARRLRPELKSLSAERVSAELFKALADCERPSTFFHVLDEVDALDVWFPELEAMFEIPAGPAAHHAEGSCYVHTMMVLDEAAALSNTVRVRLAALTHDFGKTLTPVEDLPRHIGHEKAGVPLVEAFFERLRLPTVWERVAVKACREHLRIHRVLDMRVGSIHDLIVRLGVDLEDVWTVALADARGRRTTSPSPSPSPSPHDVIVAARVAMSSITGVDVFRAYPDLMGPAFGDRLRQMRISAIKHALTRRKQTATKAP